MCAIAGVPPRDRVIDGIDLSSAIDGDTNERSNPICLWQYDTSRLSDTAAKPYIDPKLQEGTTPLTKVLDGKATRDFKNFHQPPVTEADYLGPRAIIDGDYKLVIHELKDGPPRRELFDLETDPAETTNLIEREPAVAARLQSLLRDWQRSVFDSLEGRDYQ